MLKGKKMLRLNFDYKFWLLGQGTETGGPKGWKFHRRIALEILVPWDPKIFGCLKGLGPNIKKKKKSKLPGKKVSEKLAKYHRWTSMNICRLWTAFGKKVSVSIGRSWTRTILEEAIQKIRLAKKFAEAENWQNIWIPGLAKIALEIEICRLLEMFTSRKKIDWNLTGKIKLLWSKILRLKIAENCQLCSGKWWGSLWRLKNRK